MRRKYKKNRSLKKLSRGYVWSWLEAIYKVSLEPFYAASKVAYYATEVGYIIYLFEETLEFNYKLDRPFISHYLLIDNLQIYPAYN